MRRAARTAGLVALALPLGAIIAAILGLAMDLVAYPLGFDTLDPAVNRTIGVTSGLIGLPLGFWLVFRRAIRRRKSAPTATGPPEQWGKRPP